MTPSVHTPCNDVPWFVDSPPFFHHMMHEIVEYEIPKDHIGIWHSIIPVLFPPIHMQESSGQPQLGAAVKEKLWLVYT